MLPITIRTRIITESDLQFIQKVVNDHWDKGRTHISRVLCQRWKWYQHNGRPKDMACREIFLTLYRKGFIKIPPAKRSSNNDFKNKSMPVINIDKSPMEWTLFDFAPVCPKLEKPSTMRSSMYLLRYFIGFG